MTYEEALHKLAPAGQEHLLQYYEEINEEQKKFLLRQIEDLDLSLLELIQDGAKEVEKGKLESEKRIWKRKREKWIVESEN